MKTVTTRIPEEDEKYLKELEKEKGKRSDALRTLIEKGIKQWRKEKALKLLKEHQITLRKAAEIAGVTYPKMMELASEEQIDLGYDLDELEKDMERL